MKIKMKVMRKEKEITELSGKKNRIKIEAANN